MLVTIWAKEAFYSSVSYCDTVSKSISLFRTIQLNLSFWTKLLDQFPCKNGISGPVLLPWQLVSTVPSPATGDDEALLMLDNRSRWRGKEWVKWSESTRPVTVHRHYIELNRGIHWVWETLLRRGREQCWQSWDSLTHYRKSQFWHPFSCQCFR